MIDFFADFSQNFSEQALVVLKNPITISITIFCTVEHRFNRAKLRRRTELFNRTRISDRQIEQRVDH